MKKNLCKVGVGILTLLVGSPALAATLTVGFNPSTQTVNIGDSITVDVLGAIGSGDIISAFDLDLRYDASFIRATAVAFTNSLGDLSKLEAITASDLTTPGLTNFADLSLLSDADLVALQSTSFPLTLATITFRAINSGTSSLEFVNYGVGGKDIKGAGNTVYSPTLETGTIVVASASPVPEASTFTLGSIGVCCLCFTILVQRRIREMR